MIKILYAEDDEGDGSLFREAVTAIPHDVKLTVVRNGEELMEILEMPFSFDLIFLDINMPRKNGIDCMKHIRKKERFKNLPVIIFATPSHEETIKTFHKLGANLFIAKPNRFIEWKQVISKALSIDYEIHTPHSAYDKFILTPN